MKTLYFECNMGAAGDMLMAALLELHSNPVDFLERLNNIGIPNVSITSEASEKCGIRGTHIKVEIDGREEGADSGHHGHHGHHHSGYHDIEHLINHLKVSDTVKRDALEVYGIIANAESHVHGVSVSEIHFHEVGTMDAVADIVGVCMLIEELAPELILASPINTGSGHVKCAHGILPVPAPATVHILRNVPVYNDKTIGELCTPTGAALLKYFVRRFCEMPTMAISDIGYGMGKRDFDKANCVRAYMGNTDNNAESVTELICNLDDMTPEAVAFAQQTLFENGALDVYTAPIGMKKGRMGLSFACICRNEDKDKMVPLIFRHTTTLGIRENICTRYTLQREQRELRTKFGAVRVKTASGFGVKKAKPEYEDIAEIAHREGLSIREVMSEIDK